MLCSKAQAARESNDATPLNRGDANHFTNAGAVQITFMSVEPFRGTARIPPCRGAMRARSARWIGELMRVLDTGLGTYRSGWDARGLLALLMAMVVTLAVAAVGSGVPGLATSAQSLLGSAAQITDAFGRLPMSFVENRGQADDRARYVAQGAGYTFFFTPSEVVLSLVGGSGAAGEAVAAGPSADGVALSLRFLDANPGVLVEGAERLPGQVNYVRGSNAAGWQTGVPPYASVVYRELWPGIDAVLRGDGGQLKYEFRVAPGASPADIRLAYAGANGLRLDGDGALVVQTAVGPLRDAAPVSYQHIDGKRVPVDSRYQLGAAGGYGFALGAYRADQPLVIDPGLEYSTFVGGSSHEQVHGVAVDGDGNAIVVGLTQSDDFPTTLGAVDRTFNGGVMDVFVTKFNATGSGLVYSTYMGGTPARLRRGSETPFETARAVAVDAAGNAYVTGQTTSPKFPTTSGAFQTRLNATPNVANDAFVTKLSPTGSLVYSTFLGGGGFEDGRDIAVDSSGNAYVVGETGSDNFPTTGSAFQGSRAGNRDGFVTKLNATGSGLLYSTYLGGSLELDRGDAVAVDSSGAMYVAGSTRSTDFPTTAGSFQPVHSGGEFAELFEVFVTKLTPAGALSYSTFLGTSRRDFASDLAVDSSGNAYATGTAGLSSEFPTTAGVYDTAGTSGSRAFVTKLDAAGSGLVYSTFFPVTKIALNANGSAWLAGGRSGDAYLAKLDAAGSAIEDEASIGGSQGDGATAVATGPSDSVFIAGNTMSADFPTTEGAFDRTWAGDPSLFWGDGFVAKFAPDGAPPPPPPPPPAELDSLTLDPTSVSPGSTSTGTVSLTGAAPSGWAEVSLFSSSPSTASVPSSVTVPEGATSATFTVSTSSGVSDTSVSLTARYDGQDRVAELTITGPAEVAVSSLALSPNPVAGGSPSTGMVTLAASAPSGGAVVDLTSSNTAVATVPPSVSVPAGDTSATFTASTSASEFDQSSAISAAHGGETRTVILQVTASGGSASLSSLSLSPTSVTSGDPSAGTVTLTAAAPSGGASVALSSSNTSAATVPASVTVPAGSTSATFTVSTGSVNSDASSTISATYGGTTRSATLTVTAPSSTDTVTISRAEYTSSKRELRVEASSSSSGAALRVYVTSTDQLIGTLSGGKGEFSWPSNPENITVRSSLGGSASRNVTLK
ncbi:MAG: hypothetical protein GEU74_15380 [Nitriliruptorales bacterium]|nr:hypothetical protein [Nitriliruptorales bacterium]